jgi:hypothetical protein
LQLSRGGRPSQATGQKGRAGGAGGGRGGNDDVAESGTIYVQGKTGEVGGGTGFPVTSCRSRRIARSQRCRAYSVWTAPVHSRVCLHARAVQVRLPLDIGTRVDCKWRDGAFHTVRVIERRNLGNSSDPRAWDYYVHYIGCESPRRCGSQTHAPPAGASACDPNRPPALLPARPPRSQPAHGRVGGRGAAGAVHRRGGGRAGGPARQVSRRGREGGRSGAARGPLLRGWWPRQWRGGVCGCGPALAARPSGSARNRCRKGQKKKMAAEEHDSDSEHADFDPNALREHEEFTKVGRDEGCRVQGDVRGGAGRVT